MKALLTNVHPWRHDLAGCLHACAATLLRYYGVPPLDALGAAWGFYYPPDDYRPEEYYFPRQPGRSLVGSLAPYHGAWSMWHHPADATEGWDQVRAQVAADRPVAVAVDSFYLPFRPAYHDAHANHLIVVFGFDDERGTVRVLDAIPPRFDGDISIAELIAARDSGNHGAHDRDMFFANQPIGNRWLEVRADRTERPSRTRAREHLHRNVSAFAGSRSRPGARADPYLGMAGLRAFLGAAERRLAAGGQVADELFIVAGTALATSALHADWLTRNGRAFGEPRWTELGRQVERIAHHWTSIQIMAALSRSGSVSADRLRRRNRALLDDMDRVLSEMAEIADS